MIRALWRSSFYKTILLWDFQLKCHLQVIQGTAHMTFSVCQNRTSCGACSLFSASPSLQATIPFSHPVRAVQPHTTDGKPKGLSKKTAEGRHCWHKINSFSWYSPSWSFQEWKQLGKGCMRCLDSGGTRLWPLLLKQPHTALTARTLHSYHMLLAGKGYGLAKGNFPLYFVRIKNCDLLPISITIYAWSTTFTLWFFSPCIMPENH